MTNDIFSFWSEIDANDSVHPKDRELLSRRQHKFDLSGLPGCFMGPLREAPIVLLYLAPGPWDPQDSQASRAREVREWHIRTRTGNEPLPGPEYSLPTWGWWSARTSLFGHWEHLKSNVAFLNIAPYHSTGTFQNYSLLSELPSSLVALEWARQKLFPAAKSKKRVVVCLRSAKYWGLEPETSDGFLFVPRFNRSGHMLHGEMRETVANTIKDVLTDRSATDLTTT